MQNINFSQKKQNSHKDYSANFIISSYKTHIHTHLHEKADMTVILVSHSMEDIAKYVDRIIVMNKGSVMFNDVPKKVFAHYKELESVGLAAPQVTYIMHALKEKGMDVPTDATTIEEAADGIMKALKKERAAK